MTKIVEYFASGTDLGKDGDPLASSSRSFSGLYAWPPVIMNDASLQDGGQKPSATSLTMDFTPVSAMKYDK
jgi:hypothetical protein